MGATHVVENVFTVQRRFPPGTVLRSSRDNRCYMIGTKYGRSEFWMMPLDGGGKVTVPAHRILTQFKKDEVAS